MDSGLILLVVVAITVYAAFIDDSPRGHRRSFWTLVALLIALKMLGL